MERHGPYKNQGCGKQEAWITNLNTEDLGVPQINTVWWYCKIVLECSWLEIMMVLL